MGAETQEPKDAGQAAAATGFKIELSQHCGRDCAIDLNSFSNIFNSDLKYLFCCWGVGSVILLISSLDCIWPIMRMNVHSLQRGCCSHHNKKIAVSFTNFTNNTCQDLH